MNVCQFPQYIKNIVKRCLKLIAYLSNMPFWDIGGWPKIFENLCVRLSFPATESNIYGVDVSTGYLLSWIHLWCSHDFLDPSKAVR